MRARTVNLTFHGVGERDRPAEPGEEQVWLDLDSFASVLDSVVDRSDIRITFDDGNQSDVMHALPALCRRNLRATFFVVAGRLGAPGFLDEQDVRALLDAGMGIGSHGMRHRPWRRLEDGALREELADSKRILEEIVERPVTKAACPFGSYDRRVLQFMRRYGYQHVYTSDRGKARSDAWLQPRNSLQRGAGAAVVEQIVSSRLNPAKTLLSGVKLAVKRWR